MDWDTDRQDGIHFTQDFQAIAWNRIMISGFPEEQQKEILANNSASDAENGIYRLAKKINVGLIPSADSLKRLDITIENVANFIVDTIEIGGFTPLVLIGSYWYDSEAKLARFCGEEEFDKDLSSDTLKKVPHYYVFGIKVH